MSRRFTPAAAAGTAAGFRPYVLFVGSVQPRKNLRTLLHAWVEGEFARRPLELVIVGAGARAFAREPLGPCPRGVRFLGRVDEALLPVLYARATAFVLPSLYEGFGLPVLEAMASGVPVICANAAALPEVAGDAAVLVEPRDVHGLAHALARVLDEDQWQNELRARGLRRAAEFSWRATAARISSVLADAQAESAS